MRASRLPLSAGFPEGLASCACDADGAASEVEGVCAREESPNAPRNTKIARTNLRVTVRLLSGYEFLDNRKRPAQTESSRCNFQARRGLSALVFVAVDFARDRAN